jgi:hypothetical protein
MGHDMRSAITIRQVKSSWKQYLSQDQSILLLSVLLKLALGTLFGHFYDMRIFYHRVSISPPSAQICRLFSTTTHSRE